MFRRLAPGALCAALIAAATLSGCGASARDNDTSLTFTAKGRADIRSDVPIVAKRLKVLGLTKAKVKTEDHGRKLVVSGTGSADKGVISGVVTRPVDLTFRPVTQQTALPCEAGPSVVLDARGLTCFQVGDAVTADVATASAEFARTSNTWSLRIDFTEAGGAAFKALAAEQVNKQLAIVLDGTALAAPIVQPSLLENFNNTAVITGNFNEQQAKVLAAALAGGPLPVPLLP